MSKSISLQWRRHTFRRCGVKAHLFCFVTLNFDNSPNTRNSSTYRQKIYQRGNSSKTIFEAIFALVICKLQRYHYDFVQNPNPFVLDRKMSRLLLNRISWFDRQSHNDRPKPIMCLILLKTSKLFNRRGAGMAFGNRIDDKLISLSDSCATCTTFNNFSFIFGNLLAI